jgi:hypothetical protein
MQGTACYVQKIESLLCSGAFELRALLYSFDELRYTNAAKIPSHRYEDENSGTDIKIQWFHPNIYPVFDDRSREDVG